MKISDFDSYFKYKLIARFNKQIIPIVNSAIVGLMSSNFSSLFLRYGNSSLKILFPHLKTHKWYGSYLQYS